MTIIREERIGDCRLIQGDCLEVMPLLDTSDLVLTDPPYGIQADKGFEGFEGFGGFGKPIPRKQYVGNWDDNRPNRATFEAIIAAGTASIIFGGNYFTDLLPVGRQWFVWDKKNTMPTFSDCELAWTNIDRKSVKLLTYEYNGLIGKREQRVHPTQKPVQLYEWILDTYVKEGSKIIDTHLGSGSIAEACWNRKYDLVGIEIDKEYYSKASKRLEAHKKQLTLF